MHKILPVLAITLLGLALPAAAQTKVVVVPLGGDDCDPCYSRTINVAPSGAQFAHPAQALASIAQAGASENNRFLIKIAAGSYTMTEPLALQTWVDVEGAGSGTTTLVGALSEGSSADSTIVLGEDNAEIRDLTVINNGGGCWVTAMHNEDVSPTIRRVHFEARGSVCQEFSTNTGVFNTGDLALPEFYDVESTGFAAASGTYASVPSYGIWNFNGAISTSFNSHFSGIASSGAGDSVRATIDSVAVFHRGFLPNGIFVSDSILRCVEVERVEEQTLNTDCTVEPS